MRALPVVLVAALAAAACTPKPSDDGGGGKGGSPGSGGAPAATGGTTPSTGGAPSGTGGSVTAPGTGGVTAPGTGGSVTAPGTGGGPSGTGGGPAQTPDTGSAETSPPPVAGGKALLVVGTIPIVGTDTVFEATLKSKGLEVEIVQESAATPAHAEGKRLVLLSYSMKSTALKAEPFAEVPVPIIVTEHNLLPRLKMVPPGQNGFTPSNLTKITIINEHPDLTAGFPKGEVTVYMRMQEMFWGVPTQDAIQLAHITGQPAKITYFVYEKGKMMAGLAAPAKRIQFFHATHSPDPIDRNLYLNENGIKLLAAVIDWCMK